MVPDNTLIDKINELHMYTFTRLDKRLDESDNKLDEVEITLAKVLARLETLEKKAETAKNDKRIDRSQTRNFIYMVIIVLLTAFISLLVWYILGVKV